MKAPKSARTKQVAKSSRNETRDERGNFIRDIIRVFIYLTTREPFFHLNDSSKFPLWDDAFDKLSKDLAIPELDFEQTMRRYNAMIVTGTLIAVDDIGKHIRDTNYREWEPLILASGGTYIMGSWRRKLTGTGAEIQPILNNKKSFSPTNGIFPHILYCLKNKTTENMRIIMNALEEAVHGNVPNEELKQLKKKMDRLDPFCKDTYIVRTTKVVAIFNHQVTSAPMGLQIGLYRKVAPFGDHVLFKRGDLNLMLMDMKKESDEDGALVQVLELKYRAEGAVAATADVIRSDGVHRIEDLLPPVAAANSHKLKLNDYPVTNWFPQVTAATDVIRKDGVYLIENLFPPHVLLDENFEPDILWKGALGEHTKAVPIHILSSMVGIEDVCFRVFLGSMADKQGLVDIEVYQHLMDWWKFIEGGYGQRARRMEALASAILEANMVFQTKLSEEGQDGSLRVFGCLTSPNKSAPKQGYGLFSLQHNYYMVENNQVRFNTRRMDYQLIFGEVGDKILVLLRNGRDEFKSLSATVNSILGLATTDGEAMHLLQHGGSVTAL